MSPAPRPGAGAPSGSEELEAQVERLARRLPGPAARALRWLRRPSARPLRLLAGSLLVLGGLLSILPLLAIWMLPLGLLLLSQDVPALRGPTTRALGWVERRWGAGGR